MTEIRYCIAPECDPPRPVAGHGKDLCSTHLKQVQRRGRTTEIAQKVSLEEQVFSAMERWADSGDNDAEYEANKRACIALAKRLGSKELSAELNEIRLQLTQTVEARRAKLRSALARARAAGVRLGRPPRISDEQLQHTFEVTRSVTRTAQIHGLHRSTVYERLARLVGKTAFPRHRATAPRPRLTG
jgi:hypothetical protein